MQSVQTQPTINKMLMKTADLLLSDLYLADYPKKLSLESRQQKLLEKWMEVKPTLTPTDGRIGFSLWVC